MQDGSGMKRPRKNKPLISGDEIAEMASRLISLDPPDFGGIYRTAFAKAVDHELGNKNTATQKTKSEAKSKRIKRLFFVTHALMIEFYKASKIGPPLRNEAGITRRTAIKISELLSPKMHTALSTIEKCFENPSSIERPGAALRARQLVCYALGSRTNAFTIEGDCVSFRNETALLDNVRQALASAVTVSELKDAVFEADIHRRSKAKKRK
jgi:hypothetical protein